jgi:ATP-dependent Clp protease ATP-binding subunit ClpA
MPAATKRIVTMVTTLVSISAVTKAFFAFAGLTVASGQVFDLRGFYIICTSNIGAAEVARMVRSEDTSVERAVNARLRQKLRPEFLGRFGRMLVFRKLGFETQVEICQSKIEKALRLMAGKGHHLTVGDGIVNFLVSVGYNDEFGARRNAARGFSGDQIPSAPRADERLRDQWDVKF